MEKTIAIIVTFNRQKLLSECIESLRKQTHSLDQILVINNGSTDNTEQWLKNQKDLIFITQNNTGSAGGFSAGIKWAFENNFSWMWCMDDDGYPKENALQNLLTAAEGRDLTLLNCAVIDKEDKTSFVWKTGEFKTLKDVNTNIIEGIGHPFNGTLVHRKIVERVGVPQSRYFLWGDETEYYYRITRKNKIPVCTVADSIHYHPSTAFSIKQDWDYVSGWKMYFYVRNRFHIHKTKFSNSFVALFNYLCFIAAFAGIILLFQKTDKFKKLKFLFWPVSDAFTNHFEATPPAILLRLKSGTSISWMLSLTTFSQNVMLRLFTPSLKSSQEPINAM
jgi:rhamnopyranosyl-N-acetylglucosaminyl-diphospho-decaprenol beta-1,3/1,4-galactofuranosyltransferase